MIGVRAPSTVANEIENRREDLVERCNALTSRRIGTDVTIFRPELAENPRYDFLVTTIWLHGWLQEAWHASMHFLLDHSQQVSVEASAAQEFQRVLGRLRTYLAHNLDPTTTEDSKTKQTCYTWFEQACETRVPAAADWEQCLSALLEQASAYLATAIDIARAIEKHPDTDMLRRSWADRLIRTEAVVNYLSELQVVAGNLGYQGDKLPAVLNRHRRQWNNSFSIASASEELPQLRSRHMERAMLAETSSVLPISAHDVMKRLALPPGTVVADALRLAQALYALRPDIDGASLLEWLAVCWTEVRASQAG